MQLHQQAWPISTLKALPEPRTGQSTQAGDAHKQGITGWEAGLGPSIPGFSGTSPGAQGWATSQETCKGRKRASAEQEWGRQS